MLPYGYTAIGLKHHPDAQPCQSARMSKITNDGRLNSVWHRMFYSCTVLDGNSGRQRVNIMVKW